MPTSASAAMATFAELRTTHSVVATDATSTAHRLAGGQAAYNDSRILRALRDVHTARQHMLFARGLATRLAPIATGIDMAAMPFVV